LANSFSIWQRVWHARLYPGFRDKLTRMIVDYLQEASVLVSVLGILDFVITWRQQPTIKVIAWSLGIAITLLGLAVIIQAANEPEPKDLSIGTDASNLEGEGTDNA